MRAVVFDLGGTHLRCAAVDERGRLCAVEKTRITSFIHGDQPRTIWQKIVSAITNYESAMSAQLASEAPMVISFPGPIAPPAKIVSAPTVVGDDTAIPDLVAELTALTRRRTYILNDISAAAWHISRLVDFNRFMVITISSGIGSKVFDRQHPRGVLDDVVYAGEIGHAKVDHAPDALRCDCGGVGHLGGIASGRGIERFARLAAAQDEAGFGASACARQFGASADALDNERHLVPAAALGDAWALDVIRQCTRPLARALLSTALAVGLEKVVVIGGFALQLGEVYLDILRPLLRSECDYPVMKDRAEGLVMLGSAQEEACLEGAAVYALRRRAASV
ncbi:MAG TPA: ROK family protein [Blastocatellia bacterium]|nr:ROK family protein [Blastocatellia bacterium]